MTVNLGALKPEGVLPNKHDDWRAAARREILKLQNGDLVTVSHRWQRDFAYHLIRRMGRFISVHRGRKP